MSIAIITGASSGLGKAFCRALKDLRSDISEYWLVARRADRLQEMAAELSSVKVRVFPLDLTDPASLQALVGSTEETEPPVVEPKHPVSDTTGKFANLRFGPSYDPTQK